MLAVLIPLVLLMSGLSAGVLLGTQLGGFPLLAALPTDRYVHAHAFFATRYDPFMPICFVGTVLGDIALAVLAPKAAASAIYVVGAVLALATVLISLIKNVPTNKWVQTLDPDNLPEGPDYEGTRTEWGRWNRNRSYLAVAALVANCAALALLL
ncbi:MAG TPA: DUF1772 domain-containing protein [Actinokineospora sp.]|nr:DUF1772 domain-containing protein [Actinokineospora sp.]